MDIVLGIALGANGRMPDSLLVSKRMLQALESGWRDDTSTQSAKLADELLSIVAGDDDGSPNDLQEQSYCRAVLECLAYGVREFVSDEIRRVLSARPETLDGGGCLKSSRWAEPLFAKLRDVAARHGEDMLSEHTMTGAWRAVKNGTIPSRADVDPHDQSLVIRRMTSGQTLGTNSLMDLMLGLENCSDVHADACPEACANIFEEIAGSARPYFRQLLIQQSELCYKRIGELAAGARRESASKAFHTVMKTFASKRAMAEEYLQYLSRIVGLIRGVNPFAIPAAMVLGLVALGVISSLLFRSTGSVAAWLLAHGTLGVFACALLGAGVPVVLVLLGIAAPDFVRSEMSPPKKRSNSTIAAFALLGTTIVPWMMSRGHYVRFGNDLSFLRPSFQVGIIVTTAAIVISAIVFGILCRKIARCHVSR